MRKIDLTKLRDYQEVPKISYKPIKVLDDRIFFAKYVDSISHYKPYVEGIYVYIDGKLSKVDVGFHTQNPADYDLFVPTEYEDILAIDDIHYVLYSIVTQNKVDKSKSNIVIYAIDVNTCEQIEVFSIKFNDLEFDYSGFRVLSDTFILIELLNLVNLEVKEWDKLFLLNIYTNEIIEIQDIYAKYSAGMLYIDDKNNYVYLDEVYMSEEDETAILTTDIYDIDSEQDVDINPFNNLIKVSAMDDFLSDAKIGKVKFDMEVLDKISDDGILRVIGSTKDYIYYKKSKHQNILQSSKEFLDRVLIGKEEVFAINKSTKNTKKITNLDLGSIFSFDQDKYNKIYDEISIIKIVDIASGNTRYIYKKENHLEEFSDFIMDRYLLVEIDPMKSSKKIAKLIDIDTGNVEILAKEISFVKDTFFYEKM